MFEIEGFQIISKYFNELTLCIVKPGDEFACRAKNNPISMKTLTIWVKDDPPFSQNADIFHLSQYLSSSLDNLEKY